MSMYLDFEPHSWYMGFAVMDTATAWKPRDDGKPGMQSMQLDAYRWHAFIDDGNHNRIDELKASTLGGLYAQVIAYHLNHQNGYGERIAKRRLNYLRAELRAERISYGELNELASLTPYIEEDDVELLEAAGVPE
jgi:hypothetical protein